jgi:hypothetical protein
LNFALKTLNPNTTLFDGRLEIGKGTKNKKENINYLTPTFSKYGLLHNCRSIHIISGVESSNVEKKLFVETNFFSFQTESKSGIRSKTQNQNSK